MMSSSFQAVEGSLVMLPQSSTEVLMQSCGDLAMGVPIGIALDLFSLVSSLGWPEVATVGDR